jgi:DNA polymerase-3 subunit gamma/tau
MAVFHLKYRPLKIVDLDLGDVSEVLSKILSSEEIPQSFLFAGPKGAGKTSAARILARAVNCTNPQGIEPCGECDNCKEILNGSSLDIIEIDAASNRGIEDVRALKEKAYLSPSKLKKKVFIIDEVHMLTKDAFNALLKLIEEPPKNTIFILCTTDPEKIPDTVLSRLIRVDFKKGSKKELKQSLMKVVDGEGIEIDKEAVELIVDKSDGSFRNLHRTFNEIYLQYGKKINTEDVKEFLVNKSGSYSEIDFERDLIQGDIKPVLEKLEDMAEKGIDFQVFRQKLLAYFQKRLLSAFGIGQNSESQILTVLELEFLINLLIKAAKQEKDVEIDQLPLELAVVEFMTEKKGAKTTGSGNNGGSKNGDEDNEKVKVAKESTEKPETQAAAEDTFNETIESNEPPVNTEEVEEEKIVVQEVGPVDIEEIEKKWGNLLLAVKPYNHSVEAFLRSTRPKSINGSILTLEVFYPFHKDRLEEAKNRKIVEIGLTKVFGVDLAFECILGKTKREPLVIQNDTPAENISDQLRQNDNEPKKDLYDVAKEIFG